MTILILKFIHKYYLKKKGNHLKFDNDTLSFDFTIKECNDKYNYTYISQDIENVGLKSWYDIYIYTHIYLFFN